MEDFGIGLIGCGTVGGGVAKLLLEQPQRLAARAGRRLVLKKIAVKDTNKARSVSFDRKLITNNVREILDDPSILAVVEVVGGTDWARQVVKDALAAGKDVVTANKALLATHGPEIFDAGRRHGRAIAFEASVGGGIPIIGALSHGLAANQIESIQGILNGTCNYILTAMTEHGTSYQEALAQAQKLGYAEADPTMDVDGTDTAQKLAILAQIAFGVTVRLGEISRRGIDAIHQDDIRYARELGYTIKLLAEARLEPRNAEISGQLAIHVSPVMLRHLTPLAQVRDAYNAIFVVGDAVGSTLYYGRGAGEMPTASAVVADVIDLATGRAQRTFETQGLWSSNGDNVQLLPTGNVASRYYLRLMVLDRPGVLAEVARVLSLHDISIASVIQHEAVEGTKGAVVPLIIMTHAALAGNFSKTLAELGKLESIAAPSVYYPVAF